MNAPVPEERLLEKIRRKQGAIPDAPDVRREEVSAPKNTPAQNKAFFRVLVLLLLMTSVTAVLFFEISPQGQNPLEKATSASQPPAPALSQAPSTLKNPDASPKSLKTISPPAFLVLSGILEGEDKTAIVENKETGQTQTLREGDYCLHYKIKTIEKNRVVFTNEEETFILSL